MHINERVRTEAWILRISRAPDIHSDQEGFGYPSEFKLLPSEAVKEE